MKLQKVLCPLLAGAVLCTGITALPASAIESKYQLGDVNMDGKIDVDDAVLALRDYVRVVVVWREEVNFEKHMAQMSILTEEQRYLANVYDNPDDRYCVTPNDVVAILQYYISVDVCGRSYGSITDFVGKRSS